MKRTLSLVLSVIMILGIFASMPVTVSAASVDVLTFDLNSDGKSYSVTSCDESITGDLVIPETYNGLPVTRIDYYVFDGCSFESITIPRTIKKLDASFDGCSVGKIHITDLAAWCSIDFLFYHNPGWLDWVGNPLSRGAILYLNGEKLKTDLVIPEGAKEVSDGCFTGIHFDSITFPESIEYIGYDSFSATTVYLPNYGVAQNLQLGTGGYFIDMSSDCFNNPLFRADYVYINNEDFTETVQQHCYNGDWYWESDGAFASCDCDQTWYRNCTRCGYEQTKIVPATSHVLHTYILDTPTCTVEGYKSIECENCSYCVYEEIPATGHTEAPLDATDPTCTKPGLSEGTHCSVCGEVFVAQTETAPPTGHTEGDWIIDTDSTCTAKGTKHTECTVCGVTISTGEIYEKPHQTKWFEINAPTCSDSGKRVKKCTVCNNEIEVETIPASGHAAGEWIIDKEATCTENGSKHIDCTVCGDILDTSEIVATGHKAGDWIIDTEATCTEKGSQHKECTVCGDTLDTSELVTTEHVAGEWIVDIEATASAPGAKHTECTVCGETLETTTIPQLKPATPKVATTNEIGGVQVKWNAVDGATKYVVFRRQGGYNTWVNVGTTTGNTLLDKNVKSGIFYVYSVRAYNNAGQYSDFVSANTNTRKYMATPKLTTIYNHVNGLAIKWNAVAGITEGYRVYRRGAGSTYWTYLGTTKNLYFIDNAVKNKSGEYFRYTVIADGDYHSKFDTTGLYLRRLANPTLTSAVSSKSGITVKWGAVKGTTGYYVYRKTANSTWTRVGTVGGTNNATFLDKTAKKGTTYTYTVKAVYGATTSGYYSGISCKDKY